MEDIQEDFIKISFRSKDDLDVNLFSRSYFGGGGHINAAGGRSELSIEDTLERFKILSKRRFLNLVKHTLKSRCDKLMIP